MKRLFKLIEKYYFIIILISVVIAFINPKTFNWVLEKFIGMNIINILLGVILFGMGTTLKIEQFVNVFKRPKEILLGVCGQYLIMPLLALTIARLFSLNEALTVGLILVGTVPGGTASDVITFLAKGDLALSVSLTAVSTVISPILTPLITFILIGNAISFSPADMFISIVQIVIIPIGLGLIINYKFPHFCKELKDYLPAVSSIVIAIIVTGVIGSNKEAIISSSMIIILVIIIQYFIGMALGFTLAYLSGMKPKQMITIGIELCFQNSGLSTSLAKTHFPNLTLATVPGALYSVWQNFAGSILAYIFTRYFNKEE
ncbi:bile acid:sodium symporter family protein [uncultured Methanobrevibacter sp.]|uniref:bile acid:sodium symporter family protein n=1 Tax=uncultured Methanobrevibacter sp. TaxID=253161 RepID=UPI0025DF2F13|nr:bile acid:sodium symporter family protein [uncultured Methanobrevibacter sp.]